MTAVCQKCGTTGFSELLVYCSKCKTSAEHQYCLDKTAFCDEKAHWLCEQCVPSSFKVASFDTVNFDQRRSTRKLQYQNQWVNCADILKVRNRHQRILNTAKLLKMKLKDKNSSGSEDRASSGFDLHGERPSGFDKIGVLEFDPSTADSLHKEVENRASVKCVKNEKTKRNRRKLMLAQEDQSDEEVPFHCSDQNVFKGSMRRRLILPNKDQLDEKVTSACIDRNLFEESTKRRLVLPVEDQSDVEVSFACIDQNVSKETMSRRLIIPEEEQADEDVPFAYIDENVFKESPLQADVCSVSLPSLQCAKDIFIPSVSETDCPDTAMNRSHLGCVEAPKSQAILHREALRAQEKMSCHWTPTTTPVYLPAQPVLDNVWRGYFDICNEVYGPLTAHLSSVACEKVCRNAKILPTVLRMEKLSRLDEWPKSYRISPPTNDHIALYFFPHGLSRVDQLLEDVMKNDLVLKTVLDESELLVFASVTLPKDCNRFLGKYFLWGAFKARKVPNSRDTEDCAPKSNEITGDKLEVEISEHRDEREIEAVEENSSGDASSVNYIAVKQTVLESGPVEEAEMKEVDADDKDSRDVIVSVNCIAVKQTGLESGRMEEAEMKEVDAHDEDSSDVVDVANDSTSDRSMVRTRLVPDSSRKPTHSSEVQIMDFREHAQQTEDSEVRDEEADDEAVDDCLPLFPLQVEDIALMFRGRRSNKLNLELSLGCSGGDDNGYQDCSSESNPPAKMFLDSAIF